MPAPESELHEYELWQFGAWTAGVSAPTKEDALREINHYAAVYSQDGPVEIVKKGEKPKRAHPITDDEMRAAWGGLRPTGTARVPMAEEQPERSKSQTTPKEN